MNQNKNSELELSEQAYKYLKEQNDFDLRYHSEKLREAKINNWGLASVIHEDNLSIAKEIFNLLSQIKVIGETELLLNSAEAIRKADNYIFYINTKTSRVMK